MYDPGVDVVVVNYKTPRDLSGFLESLDANRPKGPWRAVVVNVEPGPDDVEVAEKWRASAPEDTLHVVRSTNVGYARACNRAAQLTNKEVVAFFNADVRLTPEAVDDCVEAILSDPTWAVLGPRQVDEHGRLTAAGIFGSGKSPRHRGWHHQDTGQFADIRDDAVTIAGSAYFVRRDVWDQLTACPLYQRAAPGAEGAFLPTPHYFEETFCSYHATAHGYRCVYYGFTTIIHRWHGASVVGGYAEQQFPVSQRLFREACDVHGIAHD